LARVNHKTLRGKILYFTEQNGPRREFGREWFSITRHEDGQQTLRAQCEIDAGVVAPRDVLRETIYTMDARFRPIDCYNRLHSNGKFLGAGWMRFTESEAECEALSATHGRISQRIALERPAQSLGSHPLSCDALHLPRFDHARAERIQPQPDVWMTSLEHDGCSGPLLASMPLGIEYCGREWITVPAGRFETEHYRFLVAGSMPREHPTEDVWCLPGSYVFVKATVGGYMAASFELVELVED
jgi:hypothetical protein